MSAKPRTHPAPRFLLSHQAGRCGAVGVMYTEPTRRGNEITVEYTHSCVKELFSWPVRCFTVFIFSCKNCARGLSPAARWPGCTQQWDRAFEPQDKVTKPLGWVPACPESPDSVQVGNQNKSLVLVL